jgi:hypothetical protein
MKPAEGGALLNLIWTKLQSFYSHLQFILTPHSFRRLLDIYVELFNLFKNLVFYFIIYFLFTPRIGALVIVVLILKLSKLYILFYPLL